MLDISEAVNALRYLYGKQVHVTVRPKAQTFGAHVEYTGWLGQPNLDTNQVSFPITNGHSEHDQLAIDLDKLEFVGEWNGRTRLVANDLDFMIRAAE